MIRVVPAAQAASRASGGARSGVLRTSRLQPCSGAGRTVTASAFCSTSAPKRCRSSKMARSPCPDSACRPVTVTGRESAPAASQKAAFDQSPSARTAPGERYRCPPGMAQPSGSGSVAMPKRRSAASVMAI